MDLIDRAEQAPFTGWDFGYLRGRWVQGAPPWDYLALARARCAHVTSLLDLGTGSGEKLASLRDALPARVHATEAYAPNVEVARQRLQPLGVQVTAITDLYPVPDQDRAYHLPFPDGSFDLVLSRHEAYDPSEVARVLTVGGHFLTEQVGGGHYAELNAALGAPAPPFSSWRLGAARAHAEAAGLRVTLANKATTQTTFCDVGAVVYYLRAVPWQVPGFTVARYRPALDRLHRPHVANSHPFLMEAVKPCPERA